MILALAQAHAQARPFPVGWQPVESTAAAHPGKKAQGVYAYIAPQAEASSRNEGAISNLGIIATQKGLVLIGTGPSHRFAQQELHNLEKLFGRPVVLAINLYGAADHVLGNEVYAQRHVPILAHQKTLEFMQANCPRCLRNLRQEVGAGPLTGTKPMMPNKIIQHTQQLKFGERVIALFYLGPSAQPGAIAVLDQMSGVLFAGALASWDCVPDAEAADFDGWRKAIEDVQMLPITTVVPACGQPGPKERLSETAAYISALDQHVRQSYSRNISLGDLSRHNDLPAYAGWALYNVRHGRNAQYRYLDLERQDLFALKSMQADTHSTQK